jgi:diguanylate cyclase
VPEVMEASALVAPQDTVRQNTARNNNGAQPDNGAQPEFGRGTFAPLGGMGGPPRRFARHLPIERDGGTQFLAVDDVVAIHANSHYTLIFNGTNKLFCPLAIGEVESRLDNSRFARIHRSHIVNIERVIGYKRSGDHEMVEMDAVRDYAVPISRSRVSWLKSRVAAVMGAEPDTGERRRRLLAPQ